MIDPVESIADALVTFLNGDRSGWDAELRPSIQFQAEKEGDPTKRLTVETLGTLQVLVVPFGETAQKRGRGGQALETYQVYVLIVRRIDSNATRQELARFARQLKLAIRQESRFAGFPWQGDETTAKYELEALSQLDHFANSTRFDFSGMA